MTKLQRLAYDWLVGKNNWYLKTWLEGQFVIVIDIAHKKGYWIQSDGGIYLMLDSEYEKHFQTWQRESEGQYFFG